MKQYFCGNKLHIAKWYPLADQIGDISSPGHYLHDLYALAIICMLSDYLFYLEF